MNFYLTYIGYFGPYFLLFLSLLLVFPLKSYFLYALIGFYLNRSLNSELKRLYKEPRPSSKYVYFGLDGKELQKQTESMGTQQYGMPSGHAQQAWFLTSFIHVALKNFWITLLFSLVSFNTCVQRVAYKNHTTRQVIVGSVVGLVFGFLFYHIFFKITPYILS